MKIELKDAMISCYAMNAEGGRPMEDISISYTELTITITPTDDSNNLTAPLVYGYSAVTGKRL